VGGVRWWNVKHPAPYAERIAAGASPAAAREVLDAETRRVERVLLETRLVTGLPLDVLDAGGMAAIDDLVADGLVELSDSLRAPATTASDNSASGERLVLTRRGRLLADAVVRTLVP
jgi:oxygen-independent coproporphyrinogen-3 oxidase